MHSNSQLARILLVNVNEILICIWQQHSTQYFRNMNPPDHTLSVIADHAGKVSIHADAEGLSVLIAALERLKRHVDSGKCEHDHLFSNAWAGHELSETLGCEEGGEIIHHIKIYGWTEEWAQRHGFKNAAN